MLGLSAALMWGEFDTHTRLMLELLRVVFPYMLLVCLAAVFMGMLNSRGYFFHPGDGCHAAQRGDDRHGAARRAALGGGLG